MKSIRNYVPSERFSSFKEDREIIRSSLQGYREDILRSDVSRISNSMASLSEDDTEWLKRVRAELDEEPLLASMHNAVESNQSFLNRLLNPFALFSSIPAVSEETLHTRTRALPWVVSREWGSELEIIPERDAVYRRIIESLQAHMRSGKVLVPGTSLARLQYEISSLGFETVGVEMDILRLISAEFILSGNSATISPYVLETCNRINPSDNTRSIVVPDIAMSGDVLSRMTLVGEEFITASSSFLDGEFNGIVTSFFLDTYKDLDRYISVFARVLKPGGVWINCGPSQFHYASDQSLSSDVRAPSIAELREIISKRGFVFSEENFVETEYMGNPLSMMCTKLRCFFFVASLRQ